MRMTKKVVIAATAVLAGLATAVPATAATAGRASPRQTPNQTPNQAPPAAASRPTVTYSHLNLPNGDWAQVYSDGIAEVHSQDGKATVRRVPMLNAGGSAATPALPDKGFLIGNLAHGPAQPYAPNEVVVIYRSKTSALTHALAAIGTDRSKQMFTGSTLTRMRSLRDAAQRSTNRAILDFPDATVLHITGASVSDAVTKLRANPDVAFAEPDWIASTTDTMPVPVPAAQQRAADRSAGAFGMTTKDGVPANYDLSSSAQSLLNAPGVNAVPAFSELAKRYGQLPGEGEIITNVSLGTLDDASASADPQDACNPWVQAYGPTTIVQNGQRYLDWPSMPLIPTYTASSAGALDPVGETCGDDPDNTEIGLDFSMMAPLPHQDQRAGETGSGLTDLLGIAPGASYRLVVPATPGGAVSDIDTALLAAATQTPRPDVITASLGFGFDQFGLAGRYLEDDPMTQAVISSIVASGIVVCDSANDGLRSYTNASVAPSGGSAATDVASRADQVTDLNDVELSSVASRDLDSGSVDVGASTLDDIFAAPPDNPATAASSAVQAYPETRYDGFRAFSSGYGSRVNVSAPGDNVLSIEHQGGSADAVGLLLEGGTSASAPEVAAAAAVVLQVARLTHDNALTGKPAAVRDFLAKTGTVLPGVPQSDTPVNVGPQVNVGRAVQALLDRAKAAAAPGIARVAVAQRQQNDPSGRVFLTQTDPGNISLAGALADALITIAPDWTGLPVNARFQLSGPGGQPLASTGSARLRPAAILASAGLPLSSAQSRSVTLTYRALQGSKVIAQADVTLTFGPCDQARPWVRAPVVPPVVRGATIGVHYDISGLPSGTATDLVVSHPGRFDPLASQWFRAAYAVPLTGPSGTVNVPVSALDGAGIYGIGIRSAQPNPAGAYDYYSAFAGTRVAPTPDAQPTCGCAPAPDAQPQVPTLSAAGSAPAHSLAIRYHGSFQLHYSVTNVPGAAGAVAEFSAAGPNLWNAYATFNNPNGSQRDANGQDSGSVAYVPLPGAHGTVTMNSAKLGLDPAMFHMVRVLATARDGTVTGQASGVSTIMMEGVLPADGGFAINGFGVNPDGTDGMLTSDQVTGSGATLGSVETFNQVTGAASTVVSSSHLYGTVNGAGMFAGDTGLYSDDDPASGKLTYGLLSHGTPAGAWNPPSGFGTLQAIAANASTSRTALLTGDPDSGFWVTPADIGAGTFGAPVSLSSALAGMSPSYQGGFAVDPVTGEAVAGFEDLRHLHASAKMVTVDFATGQVTAFSGAEPIRAGLTVDHALGRAYTADAFGLGAVDLTSHASQVLHLDGALYQYPTLIPGTHDIMAEEVFSPGGFGLPQDLNNNALSSVVILDQNGKVLHRYEQFNFFTMATNTLGDYLQVNPATSTGWVLGPGGRQLAPFRYSLDTAAAKR